MEIDTASDARSYQWTWKCPREVIKYVFPYIWVWSWGKIAATGNRKAERSKLKVGSKTLKSLNWFKRFSTVKKRSSPKNGKGSQGEHDGCKRRQKIN